MEPNVLLIVCDTLRKDILGVYGGEAKTPNIERLARESMVYDNCIAPSSWTLPSHVSMFTAMYPNEHRVHETEELKVRELLGKSHELKAGKLPEFMQQRGYNTIGISNNLMISKVSGFDEGFNIFLGLNPSPWFRSRIAIEASKRGSTVGQVIKDLVVSGNVMALFRYANELVKMRPMLKAANYPLNKGARATLEILMDSNLSSKFFLFINFYELHEPYKGFNQKEYLDDLTGKKEIGGARAAYLKSQYVSEAEYLDGYIGMLLSMLKERGLYDNTMIILTSDHGQGFKEHGFFSHGIYLYDELSRIPLIIKYPKGKRYKKRNGYQSLVKIPELIRDVIDGRDDGAITEKRVFAETYGNQDDIDNIPKRYANRVEDAKRRYGKARKAVYKEGFKLTVNGTDGTIEEFMKGGKNLSAKDPKNRKKLKELLQDIRKFKGGEEFRIPSL